MKHTNLNFVPGNVRQALMYWTLNYASFFESDDDISADCLPLNPRRTRPLLVNLNRPPHSACASKSRAARHALVRSTVEQAFKRRSVPMGANTRKTALYSARVTRGSPKNQSVHPFNRVIFQGFMVL